MDGRGQGDGGAPAIPAIGAGGARYPIDKLRAHRDGVLHDAVSVFIFDGDHLLIQQRAFDKYHCGGLWANTCCTHPHWGESAKSAAVRRLDEELGFSLDLTRRATTEYRADVGGGLIEHERVEIFASNVDRRAIDVRPRPQEVAAVRWMPIDRLSAEAASVPERYAPWFRIYLERFPALIF